jgi:large subunit ribosomal protein L35
MPKMKTKRAASKRFSVTANGKIKYKKMGMRKKLSKKSKRQKRELNKPGMLSKAEHGKMKVLLPYR